MIIALVGPRKETDHNSSARHGACDRTALLSCFCWSHMTPERQRLVGVDGFLTSASPSPAHPPPAPACHSGFTGGSLEQEGLVARFLNSSTALSRLPACGCLTPSRPVKSALVYSASTRKAILTAPSLEKAST